MLKSCNPDDFLYEIEPTLAYIHHSMNLKKSKNESSKQKYQHKDNVVGWRFTVSSVFYNQTTRIIGFNVDFEFKLIGQAINKSINCDCLSKLHVQSSDPINEVTFEVDGHQIKAHRCVLASEDMKRKDLMS